MWQLNHVFIMAQALVVGLWDTATSRRLSSTLRDGILALCRRQRANPQDGAGMKSQLGAVWLKECSSTEFLQLGLTSESAWVLP